MHSPWTISITIFLCNFSHESQKIYHSQETVSWFNADPGSSVGHRSSVAINLPEWKVDLFSKVNRLNTSTWMSHRLYSGPVLSLATALFTSWNSKFIIILQLCNTLSFPYIHTFSFLCSPLLKKKTSKCQLAIEPQNRHCLARSPSYFFQEVLQRWQWWWWCFLALYPCCPLSPSPLQKWCYCVVTVCFVAGSCNVGTYGSPIGFELGPLKIKSFAKTFYLCPKAGGKKNLKMKTIECLLIRKFWGWNFANIFYLLWTESLCPTPQIHMLNFWFPMWWY